MESEKAVPSTSAYVDSGSVARSPEQTEPLREAEGSRERVHEETTTSFLCCKVDKRNRKKIVQSCVLYFAFVGLGMAMGITGPTLLDLSIITRSSTDEIAFVFTSRAIGGFIGGIVASVAVNYVNNWVLVAYAMTFIGALAITLPLYKSLVVLNVIQFVWGVHGVFYDASGNVTLLKIWGKQHGPWMQALHCVFGAGALLVPLIAEPFITERAEDLKKSELCLKDEVGVAFQQNVEDDQEDPTEGSAEVPGPMSNVTSLALTDAAVVEGESHVFYAYLIVGLVMISAGLALFMIFLASPPRHIFKTKEDKKEEEETEKGTRPDKLSFKVPFLIGVFVFYVMYCVVEGNYGNFLFTYAVEGLCWSKSAGAQVTSVFWTSFTVGRGLGIPLVKLVSPQVLLGADCTLSVVSLVPLLLFSRAHPSVLWVSSIALGLTMSTIFATGITWTGRYVRVTGGVGAIFLTAGAAGEVVGPLLLSFLYKVYGIQTFVHIMFGAAAATLAVYIILQIAAFRHGERYIEDTPENDDRDLNEEEKQIELEMENMLEKHRDENSEERKDGGNGSQGEEEMSADEVCV